MDTKKLVLVCLVLGIAIAVYGVITMQILVAGALILLLILVLLFLHFRPALDKPLTFNDGWSAILAGAIVAFVFSMMKMEFLLWAVALAALFLIQQSLARIEQRLEILEKR